MIKPTFISCFLAFLMSFYGCRDDGSDNGQEFSEEDLTLELILEPSVKDFVLSSSMLRNRPQLNEAVQLASQESESADDFWSRFTEICDQKNIKLGLIYSNADFDGIERSMTNREVTIRLSQSFYTDASVSADMLKNKLRDAGFSKFSLKDLKTDRIRLKFYEPISKESVRQLITQKVELEFWRTHTNDEMFERWPEINESCQGMLNINDSNAIKFPFLYLMQTRRDNNSRHEPFVGVVQKSDSSKLNQMVQHMEKIDLFPDIDWTWGDLPYGIEKDENSLGLYALKKDDYSELSGPVLDNSFIDQARHDIIGNTEKYQPVVLIKLSDEGTQIWAELTEELNQQHQSVAIVLNHHVILAPMVNGPIYNGNIQIDGNYTEKEAQNLAHILHGQQNLIQFNIIEEKVIGPEMH